MTDREKAIVMAYTGITMLAEDKFDIFHKYVEEKLGRPIWTSEMSYDSVANEIKEAAKDDFIDLCARQEDDKFYVVTSGEYSDYKVHGVTRNWEYAEFLCKFYRNNYYETSITTYEDEKNEKSDTTNT